MTKTEFIELLESIDIPVNEAIVSEANKNKFPRIVFWDYVWDDNVASNESHSTVVTYQVSMHYRIPRDPKLLLLRKRLRENGIFTPMFTEFLQDDNEFHTYTSVEVLENLDEIDVEP